NYYTTLESDASKNFNQTLGMQNNKQLSKDADTILKEVLDATIICATEHKHHQHPNMTNIHFFQFNINCAKLAYAILRLNVNKGVAVYIILDHFNANHEQAIAFGDGMNDKEMFETVGTSVAMGNCKQDLLPYATFQTTSVDDFGVVNGLKRLQLID